MPTFFVTGATGKQGGATVSALLAANQTVRAYTRDATSPSALALTARGVTVIEGPLSESEALTTALQGCDGAFLAFVPSRTSETGELDEARAVLAAAKAAGVKHIVYSSSCTVDNREIDQLVRPDHLYAWNTRNKRAVQEELRAGGFRYWTILQPATFMTNFVSPAAEWMYPHLAAEGVLKTAFKDETRIMLVDPVDIGKFAAAAFLSPERFSSKTIPLASEWKSIEDIASTMKAVSSKRVVSKPYSEDEARGSMFAEIQELMSKIGFSVDLDYVHSWSIPMRGFIEFLESHRENLIKSIGPR